MVATINSSGEWKSNAHAASGYDFFNTAKIRFACWGMKIEFLARVYTAKENRYANGTSLIGFFQFVHKTRSETVIPACAMPVHKI